MIMLKTFKLFVIVNDLGESERQKVIKFISGLKREIAKRLKIELRLEPFYISEGFN